MKSIIEMNESMVYERGRVRKRGRERERERKRERERESYWEDG